MIPFNTVVDEVGVRITDEQQDTADEILRSGRVKFTLSNPGLLLSTVTHGGRWHGVKIEWDHRGFRHWCSSHQDAPCEHVWATLLAAEEQLFDDPEDDSIYGIRSKGTTVNKNRSTKARVQPQWEQILQRLSETVIEPDSANDERDRADWPAGRELIYIIDRQETLEGKGIALELNYRERKRDGNWSKPKTLKMSRNDIASLPDGADRMILAMLIGAHAQDSSYGYRHSYYDNERESGYELTYSLARAVIPAICQTGRCFLQNPQTSATPTDTLQSWGKDEPWVLRIEVTRDQEKQEYRLEGTLERDGEKRPLTQPNMLTAGGLVFWGDVIEPLDDRGAFAWVSMLRKTGALHVPMKEGAQFAQKLYQAASLPEVHLPEELRLEEVQLPPHFHLKVMAPRPSDYDDRLRGELKVSYEGKPVDVHSPQRAIVNSGEKRVILRDLRTEAQALTRLHQLGWRKGYSYSRPDELSLAPGRLAKSVSTLVREGWHIEAEGKLYRQPGELRIEVNSGIDWFELHGEVQFGDQIAKLPQLLAALRKGDHMIQLGDGTIGMLPEEWLKKYGALAGMGREKGDHLEFTRSQAGLLDALLAAQPQATCDAVFEKTRQMLRSFEGIAPAQPPQTFQGELRPYQKEGLGWLKFLREFSFGGCLADDMGLGKTVQVLAMLLARQEEIKSTPRPSLIVVPRSLVFNWMQEARRFAPTLKVLDHSHSQRTKAGEHLSDYHVVLTTYGTLRNDIVYLKDITFDYLILDESQAIKNPASESAKATRLLQGNHRLALSGTPVQNHLGDLWSLFDFLNPGMLGASSVLSGATALSKAVDQDTRLLLAKALRPFILRRTKEQVAKDLPAKLEQTIYCELDSAQRKKYDELKEYYRQNLLDLVMRQGINKAKIQILEALLRLRQAACHPGLIDKTHAADSSAKLDMLIPRLNEVVEEGHKALVFSQFTSFLSIVKTHLDQRKIKYEYLDGKTKNRQERVERFQNDPKLKLFLISLKAGGVGLNLTAADYVFLLDPWWNPAVEAQAIDRTHRIGQTKQVFACRLIAKDTVEEKVLELQKSKRALADAIINGDNSLISSLGREELELLLS